MGAIWFYARSHHDVTALWSRAALSRMGWSWLERSWRWLVVAPETGAPSSCLTSTAPLLTRNAHVPTELPASATGSRCSNRFPSFHDPLRAQREHEAVRSCEAAGSAEVVVYSQTTAVR
jgi:hypothetical protein